MLREHHFQFLDYGLNLHDESARDIVSLRKAIKYDVDSMIYVKISIRTSSEAQIVLQQRNP